jgi:cell division protein ZapA
MPGRPIELRVGGQTYRVVSSVSKDELETLAQRVDDKLRALVPPGKALGPNALLLAAIALANDLEEERARSERLSARAREAVGQVVGRVDLAIALAEKSLAKAAG